LYSNNPPSLWYKKGLYERVLGININQINYFSKIAVTSLKFIVFNSSKASVINCWASTGLNTPIVGFQFVRETYSSK